MGSSTPCATKSIDNNYTVNVEMCRQKTPRKNFGQIPKRKCVCKIPHPPKVELELGEETTTSHFSKPIDSTIMSSNFHAHR
jgi:hypothetical protein